MKAQLVIKISTMRRELFGYFTVSEVSLFRICISGANFTHGFKTVHVCKNSTLIEKWSTLECFLLSKEVPILCCFVNVRTVNKTDCKFTFLIYVVYSSGKELIEVFAFLHSTPHRFEIRFLNLLVF